MIIYGAIPEKNRPLAVTPLVIIYGVLANRSGGEGDASRQWLERINTVSYSLFFTQLPNWTRFFQLLADHGFDGMAEAIEILLSEAMSSSAARRCATNNFAAGLAPWTPQGKSYG